MSFHGAKKIELCSFLFSGKTGGVSTPDTEMHPTVFDNIKLKSSLQLSCKCEMK